MREREIARWRERKTERDSNLTATERQRDDGFQELKEIQPSKDHE